MKKILLLGGSAQQVIAIETAKRMGYYTILCDYLSDNPGQYIADQFYLVSTTDKEAILEVAQIEQISGILAYASDPAAPTAAYVAEKMGLPGNPYESVEILCNKDKFREYLKMNGFNTPYAQGYTSLEKAKNEIGNFRLPVIIKPVDSSGSKGITVLYELKNFEDTFRYAKLFSRSEKVIIEEYIEKSHRYLVGGDIFIQNGKVVLWGLLNCHRDNNVNPLVPVGKSHPVELKEGQIEKIKETLQRLVNLLNIDIGAMNIELILDKNDNVWPIDIGPRNGGNMIPDLLGMIYHVDIVQLTIEAAMGIESEIKISEEQTFYASHNIHTNKEGIFEEISFSEEIKKYLIRKNIYKKEYDKVEYFDNAAKALGIAFFKFEDRKNMYRFLENINQHINIRIK